MKEASTLVIFVRPVTAKIVNTQVCLFYLVRLVIFLNVNPVKQLPAWTFGECFLFARFAMAPKLALPAKESQNTLKITLRSEDACKLQLKANRESL